MLNRNKSTRFKLYKSTKAMAKRIFSSKGLIKQDECLLEIGPKTTQKVQFRSFLEAKSKLDINMDTKPKMKIKRAKKPLYYEISTEHSFESSIPRLRKNTQSPQLVRKISLMPKSTKKLPIKRQKEWQGLIPPSPKNEVDTSRETISLVIPFVDTHQDI